MANFLQKLFPIEKIKDIFTRFPLSIACAVLAFFVTVLINHNWFEIEDELLVQITAFLVCGYFWFGIGRIIEESQGWKDWKRFVLAPLGVAFLAWMIFGSEQWLFNLIFLIPGLLLLLIVAPFLTSKNDDAAFWVYNRHLWFGVALAFIGGIAVGAKLSIALAAVDYLFGIDVDRKLYSDIWTFSCYLFAPIYALTWVPNTFDAREGEVVEPPGIMFFLNWVCAPIFIIYMAILYAYFVKIGLAGELPKGQLSYIVTGFAGLGIVTYLIGYPLRDKGTPILRFILKILFPVLIVPVLVQAFAIYERVAQYGITEQRYLVILGAVWIGVMAVWFTVRRPNLKMIPLVLAGLFLFASFGPWGGVAVSGWSQTARFDVLLNKYNILQDGKIVELADAEKIIPFEDRKSISSIVEYLSNIERQDALLKYMTEEQILSEDVSFKHQGHECSADNWDYICRETYVRMMGFKFLNKYESQATLEDFYFGENSNKNKVLDISNYDFFYRGLNCYSCMSDKNEVFDTQSYEADVPVPVLNYQIIDNNLIISGAEVGDFRFDLEKFAREELVGLSNLKYEAKSLILENDKAHMQIIILSISGKKEIEGMQINDIRFDVLLKVKE
jgi:hypothetical protein